MIETPILLFKGFCNIVDTAEFLISFSNLIYLKVNANIAVTLRVLPNLHFFSN